MAKLSRPKAAAAPAVLGRGSNPKPGKIAQPVISAADAELMEMLRQDYKDLRMLADGTLVGTLDLLFTRAVIIDMDRWGWGRRYCYENKELATRACAALKSGDDVPLKGYIAERLGSTTSKAIKNCATPLKPAPARASNDLAKAGQGTPKKGKKPQKALATVLLQK